MSRRGRRNLGSEGPTLFDLPLTVDAARTPEPMVEEPPEVASATRSAPLPPLPTPPAAEPPPEASPAAPQPTADPLMQEPGIDEPHTGAAGPATASLLPRVLSGGADILAHAGALAGLTLGLYALGIEPRLAHAGSLSAFLLSFSFLYTVVSLAFWGQTAGMAWFGLAARESPQFPLSFAQAGLRWLGGLVTFSLAGLPVLLALMGASLTDRISRSTTYQSVPTP